MKVRLVSYTTPVEELKREGIVLPQDLIAFKARVSNPDNQYNTKTAEGLIKYLAAHKHWSPLEMVHACVEIETTRDIARQILRHRSFSFQEFSQRYENPVKHLEFDNREARYQDKKNRQNSIECNDKELQKAFRNVQTHVIETAKHAYKWAIDNGVAKEQARAVLPEGLTVSRLYMAGNIRSWIHYVELRSGPETQKEHREVAIACAEEIAKVFPVVGIKNEV